MPTPFDLIDFPEDHDYCIIRTYRTSRGNDQLLADIAAENKMSASETTRMMVELACMTYLEIADKQGVEVSDKLRIRLEHLMALADVSAYSAAEKRIQESFVKAMTCNDERRRNRLLEACRAECELYGIEYPPKNIPLAYRNPYAVRILDKSIELLRGESTGRIPLRLLRRSFNDPVEKIKETLEELENDGKLEIERELRSGPDPTWWISMPSIIFENIE